MQHYKVGESNLCLFNEKFSLAFLFALCLLCTKSEITLFSFALLKMILQVLKIIHQKHPDLQKITKSY